MTSPQAIRAHLREFDLRRLFIEDLGWDKAKLLPITVAVESSTYVLTALSQKRGFVAYLCEVDGRNWPNRAVRWRLEREVAKNSLEHLLVFVDLDRTTQVWEWVRRDGHRRQIRSHAYRSGATAERLAQKVERLTFDLDEEERVSIIDTTARVRAAFDTDRVTKLFYERFRELHRAFLAFISGLDNTADREWYASVMLNRLMFVYFIQKKRFLDDDPDYLRNRLQRVKRERGPGSFYTFYRHFLLRLFHDGLGHPEPRATELDSLLGRVPYLNGGLFDVHELEVRYQSIDIPDEAFELVLGLFDAYEWHLDDRPLRADNEINPDVLGYIFEKYINQKELGAYYTKEDITGYIVGKTLLPVVLEHILQSVPDAHALIADLLGDDPSAYLPAAMSKGAGLTLPLSMEQGVADPAFRSAWNAAAPGDIANPNESWRDVVRRRESLGARTTELRLGELPSLEKLITLNVDLEQLMVDFVARCDSDTQVRATVEVLRRIAVLDPACGSGAFLLSALQQLEHLYVACLERLDELTPELLPSHADNLIPETSHGDLATALLSAPNRRYAVLKAAMLNNLFGVDIVEEAVEICKLRLFLKLVAQLEPGETLEPLPDVDFNVRAGNSLIGFVTRESVRGARQVRADLDGTMASLDDQTALVDGLTAAFRALQQGHDPAAQREAKHALRAGLDNLRRNLDAECARGYGIAQSDAGYSTWRQSYQPFHWFVEFHEILGRGGFDAIVGNPPYIELRNLTQYSPRGYETESAGNLYALMLERSMSLVHPEGRQGFIVPVSSVSTDRYEALQKLLLQHDLHFSSYDDRPSRLFEGLEHVRLTILLTGARAPHPRIMSTRYQKWTADERPFLFDLLRYEPAPRSLISGSLPKLSDPEEHSILEKLGASKRRLAMFYAKDGPGLVYYSRKVGYFLQVLDFVPDVHDPQGRLRPPSEFKQASFQSPEHAQLALAVLNSSLFFWFVTVFSDCRHLNRREVDNFPVDLAALARSPVSQPMISLATRLMASIRSTSQVRRLSSPSGILTVQAILPRHSKPIIDEIDTTLATLYNLTPGELDLITNYDIKFRLPDDASATV